MSLDMWCQLANQIIILTMFYYFSIYLIFSTDKMGINPYYMLFVYKVSNLGLL